MLMTGHEAEYGLSTDEIDTITAHLINERNPVCYGKDTQIEQAVKLMLNK